MKQGLPAVMVNVEFRNGLIRAGEGWEAQLNAKKLRVVPFFFSVIKRSDA